MRNKIAALDLHPPTVTSTGEREPLGQSGNDRLVDHSRLQPFMQFRLALKHRPHQVSLFAHSIVGDLLFGGFLSLQVLMFEAVKVLDTEASMKA